MKTFASPLLRFMRTTWSTPCSTATWAVRSSLPSSTISHSTTSMPGTSRGSSASVMGSESSSLKQGIWMMSLVIGGASSVVLR